MRPCPNRKGYQIPTTFGANNHVRVVYKPKVLKFIRFDDFNNILIKTFNPYLKQLKGSENVEMYCLILEKAQTIVL